MKKLFALFVLIIIAKLGIAQVSFGESEKINQNWKFRLSDNSEAYKPEFDDYKWRNINLPHDWSVEGTLSPSLASATGYLPGGIGWYRKTLDIPAEKKGKKVFIYFEGVYRNSEVFVNGNSMGIRPNGYISFMYDISDKVRFGEKNTIAVKVDHSKYADSRWYTGSGIYRNVWLVYANPIHIDLWGVNYITTMDKKGEAVVKVQTKLVNSSLKNASLSVIHELYYTGNKLVSVAKGSITVDTSSRNTSILSLIVKNPRLWSIETPELYTLVTTVWNGKKIVDKTNTTIGIRKLEFDANTGFSLNGINTKVKGVCLHHDAGCLGSAVPDEVWEYRLKKLKEIGCNAIRTSHNPQAPIVYDLCDKLGILVFDEAFDEWEFPKKKWIEGWNVGKPQFDGASEFFKEWGKTDLRDMVLRDRNHPSVFMWSIGNEVDYPNDPYSHPILDGDNKDFTQKIFGGYRKDAPDANRLGVIAKQLVEVVKQHDVSRPVSAGLAGVAMSNETDYPSALDVAGYNYTESRYQSDHIKYPNRVIFGSENRPDYSAWKAVMDNKHIFGQFIWTGFDYLGESHAWPSRGFNSGLINLGGDIKPRGYFRQSLWSDKPMVYIGAYKPYRRERSPSIDAPANWNFNDGDTVRVVCYTNCQTVQLQLNGEKIGEPQSRDENTGMVVWNLPYKPGKLEVLGYNSSELVVTKALETSKQPFAIKATMESQSNAVNGISIISVQIVDEDGKPVFIADNEITCQTKGAIKLEGMEGSNPEDMTDYNDNHQRVFEGRMVVYIRTLKENGTGEITFTSPWLKDAQIKL